MGDIGDQIRLQTFALYLFLKSRIQTAGNIVDMLAHLLFLARQNLCVQSVSRVTGGNSADGLIQHISLAGLAKQPVEYPAVDSCKKCKNHIIHNTVTDPLPPCCKQKKDEPHHKAVAGQKEQVAKRRSRRIAGLLAVGFAGLSSPFSQTALP